MCMNLRLKVRIVFIFHDHQMSYWHNMCPIDCVNSLMNLLLFSKEYKYIVESDCNDIFIIKMCSHLFNLKPETRFSFTYNIICIE